MAKELCITPLGELAVKLKFDKLFLKPATDFYKEEIKQGRKPSFNDLVVITRNAFPRIIL